MSDCLYKISYKNNNGEDVEKKFNSELELDVFLTSHLQELTDKFNVKSSDLTLHSTSTEHTLSVIKGIEDKLKNAKTKEVLLNEDGDSETILDISKSISVTTFITSKGSIDSPDTYLITPFDKDAYFKRIGATKQERIIEETKWAEQTDCGSEIHDLFQALTDGKSLKQLKYLSDEQIKSLSDDYENFIEFIKSKHGENSIVLSEVPIISKDINQVYKDIGIESINGRIDLLVIDEHGAAHIYDFKVSKKEVGDWSCSDNKQIKENNWWPTTKKYTCEYQQYFYRAILAQYGITVQSCNIVPIMIDPVFNDKGKIENIGNVYMDTVAIQKLDFRNQRTSVTERIIPKKALDINLDEGFKTLGQFFPNYNISSHVQRNQVTFEQYKEKYVHELKEGSKNKYVVNNPYKGAIYCDTEEQVDRAIRNLVAEENTYRDQEMWDLGELLKATLNGEMSVSDFSFGNNTYVKDYVMRVFKKFLPEVDETEEEHSKNWQLISDDNFTAAGVFIFKKGIQIEIVSLTYNEIQEQVDLALGNNILGNKKRNFEVDDTKILKSTHGNIDLMKVMSLLNSNPEIIENSQIISITSHNIWTQTGTNIDNDFLLNNFKKLCELHSVNCNLESSNFASILQTTVCQINDICGEGYTTTLGLREIPNTIIDGTSKILRAMEKLKQNNPSLRDAIATGNFNFEDEVQVAYILLGKALNKLSGNEIYIETDPANWLGVSRKGVYTGLNVNSASNSPSLNVRTLARINAIAENKIRRLELEWDGKLRKVLTAYYDYHNRNNWWGNEVKYFDNLFRRDENGNIDQRFLLKHPDDQSLSKEEKDLVKVLLEIFNFYRYDKNTSKADSKKDTDEYYEVPIMLASTATLLHNSSFTEAAKHKFDENWNFLRLLPKEERNLMEARRRKELFNRFRINKLSRESIITTYGVDQLETHLEDVVRSYIHSYTSEEVMSEYLPKMQGIKFALQYQNYMYGTITKDTIEFINKFIDLNIYEQPIMDPNLRTVYKCLATVKNVTTATTLGFNWRSGLRELMQGMWVHISRTLANAYGKDQFNHGDVAQAWTIIFKDCIKNANMLTLCDSLNVEYGMANADPHQIKERLSQSQSGVMNFNSDKLYVFNRIPDSFHRLGLLIAKMIHDGCWEAHSMVDDQLVYDFKKDKRFSLLNDPSAEKNTDEYRKQHSLYMSMLNQFNKEGWTLKEGDDLPRAYTVQEGTSVKSFADLCFGHYDKSTQMLAKHMFLGAMFLQFRTFLSAKLEQWILKPGTYDQGQIKEVYNENGELMCRVYSTDENGLPYFDVVPRSQVDESKYWEPHTEWQGRFMEGILYSLWDFSKALAKMDLKTWKELWANETKRANLWLFCTDMIWMSLMMWIISAVFFGDNKDELSPLAHGMTSAMYNSFADGPIINIVASMGSDLNPPSYSIVKNLCKQTWSVLSGNRNAFDAAVNSIGALNDLKYLSNQLD